MHVIVHSSVINMQNNCTFTSVMYMYKLPSASVNILMLLEIATATLEENILHNVILQLLYM